MTKNLHMAEHKVQIIISKKKSNIYIYIYIYIYMKEEIESVSNRNSTCKDSAIGFSLYLLGK
jgi:hypothetical protein